MALHLEMILLGLGFEIWGLETFIDSNSGARELGISAKCCCLCDGC